MKEMSQALNEYGLVAVLAILIFSLWVVGKWFAKHVVEPVTAAHIGLVTVLSTNSVEDTKNKTKIESHLAEIRKTQVSHYEVCRAEVEARRIAETTK